MSDYHGTSFDGDINMEEAYESLPSSNNPRYSTTTYFPSTPSISNGQDTGYTQSLGSHPGAHFHSFPPTNSATSNLRGGTSEGSGEFAQDFEFDGNVPAFGESASYTHSSDMNRRSYYGLLRLIFSDEYIGQQHLGFSENNVISQSYNHLGFAWMGSGVAGNGFDVTQQYNNPDFLGMGAGVVIGGFNGMPQYSDNSAFPETGSGIANNYPTQPYVQDIVATNDEPWSSPSRTSLLPPTHLISLSRPVPSRFQGYDAVQQISDEFLGNVQNPIQYTQSHVLVVNQGAQSHTGTQDQLQNRSALVHRNDPNRGNELRQLEAAATVGNDRAGAVNTPRERPTTGRQGPLTARQARKALTIRLGLGSCFRCSQKHIPARPRTLYIRLSIIT